MQSADIPTKLIKELCELYAKSTNHYITKVNFIASFKEAEVLPFYKNDGRTDKSNYRPIRILSNVSKIYERCLCSQLYDYFDKNIFSKYQCDVRKAFSTQHVLLVIIEKK